jgi:hypothetical protein
MKPIISQTLPPNLSHLRVPQQELDVAGVLVGGEAALQADPVDTGLFLDIFLLTLFFFQLTQKLSEKLKSSLRMSGAGGSEGSGAYSPLIPELLDDDAKRRMLLGTTVFPLQN